MRVILNGSPVDTAASTLFDLLPELQPGYAVAVNGQVVPRRELRVRTISDGDRIELVTAVAGG